MMSRRLCITLFLGIGFLCLSLLIVIRGRRDPIGKAEERVVYQSTRNGCAPACLTMVLQSIGIGGTLDSVQTMFDLEPDGASVSEIRRVAGLFGVKATARRIRPGELAGRSTPCVVFVDNDHFAVLDSMRGRSLFVRDPARGPQSISIEDFLGRWNGIVVEFERKKTPS